jgi:hypothetical protein
MTLPLGIIIIDKLGSLKSVIVKDYKEEDLYKKCGFKKADGFELQVEWNIKVDGQSYIIRMYGKLDGKANSENKYDFPPPIDKRLYFGSCTLVCTSMHNDVITYNNLSIELWNKMYEKMFGGFESLIKNEDKDDYEDDELESMPESMKTKKGGYLKDGFVVDDDDNESNNDDEDNVEEDNVEEDNVEDITSEYDTDLDLHVDVFGSELSEEDYDYSDDDKVK